MSTSYTAIILDDKSQNILKEEFGKYTPNGWRWYGHHMTMTMGELDDDKRNEYIGKEINLTVNSLGMDYNVFAVGVSGGYTKNKIPHITLAVNVNDGGKPYMSNNITDWKPYIINRDLVGVVTEIPNQSKPLNEAYNIKQLPFYGDIIKNGGKIHQVGGAVRDLYLNKISKDLDIVISGIPIESLENILSRYGKIDLVGKSFGVIKFTPPDGETIDIALPRTDKRAGVGHKGFEIHADHNLPIEKDLRRRDITINSIAIDADGNITDPHGGVKDIKNKIIRQTDARAFADDPLRMLRCVQFGARFGFTIEPETLQNIQRNAHLISEISKERILEEFKKIIEKGNPSVGVKLLEQTGLYKGIFGTNFDGEYEPFDYVSRMSEFIFWLILPLTNEADYYYKVILGGDIPTTKEITALKYLYNNLPQNDVIKARMVYNKVYTISPSILESNFVRSHLNDVYDDFKSGVYPKTELELAIDGNDIMSLGFIGRGVGEAKMKVLYAIYGDEIKNTPEEIINYLKKDKPLVKEGVSEERRVVFYDFDKTLFITTEPEEGKRIYQEKTGEVYPHVGWWGRKESLDFDMFDIRPNPKVYAQYQKDRRDYNTYVVLLTNRQQKLLPYIQPILDKYNISFDDYLLASGESTKGSRVLNLMSTKYLHIQSVVVYDDDVVQLQNIEMVLKSTNIKYQMNQIT